MTRLLWVQLCERLSENYETEQPVGVILFICEF